MAAEIRAFRGQDEGKTNLSQVLHGRASFIKHLILQAQNILLGCQREGELEILRDRVLSELKLGKQAPGYKTAQKARLAFHY